MCLNIFPNLLNVQIVNYQDRGFKTLKYLATN